MYNLDDENYELPHLYTHDLYNSASEAPTSPIPVQALAEQLPVYVPNVALATIPYDPVAEVYRTTQDAEMTTRELMWVFMIFGALCPIFGVFMDGFLGFFIGTVLGLALGICGVVARHARIRAIDNGRTDLEFSDGEVKAELVLGAIVGAVAVAKGIGMAERHHAHVVARENQRNGFGS